MTTPHDADELLVAYLGDGMRILPDGLADAVMDEVHRTRQRTVLGPRRSPVMARFALGAAAAVAVLVLGGGLLLAQLGDTGPSGPTPNPALSPSPSLPAVIGPTTEPAASEPAGPSAGPIAPTARPTGFWIQTGTMGTPRDGRNAVRLVDGRVLVAGGVTVGGDVELTSAELYDPVTGTWTPTGSMLNPPGGFPATLLHDGTVLVSDYRDDGTEDGPRTYGAEVYDPVDGTWAATGKGTTVGGDSATVLRDGRVLIIGKGGAELYDPVAGTWTATPIMTTPRHNHVAVLLPDGKVLVAGGDGRDEALLDSAEVYDPATGSWNAIASMSAPRDSADATLLPNGRVLVYGGKYMGGGSAELYDPANGTWTPSGELPRVVHDGDSYRGGLTLLLDGTVLLAGGPGQGDGANMTALIYDPNLGSWRQTEDMLPRSSWDGSYTLLLDGTVLASGGFEGASQLYIPAGVTPPANLAPIPSPTPSPVPTPTPTPYPPEAGPVPPGARSWTVVVDNQSSAPATLFVAEENEHGTMAQLVGSVSPNVVPPRTRMRVTFLLPSKQDGASIFVNPGPELGSLLATNEAPLFGRILISKDGQEQWVGQ